MLALALLAATSIAQAQSSTKYLIDGEEPEKFYSRFEFRMSGSCDQGTSYFHFLSKQFITAKIGVNDQGQDIVVDLHVYMLGHGDYIALYEEHDVLHYTELGYAYKVTRPLAVRGKTHIEEDRLVFEGLGIASGLTYNDSKALELEISEDLISVGLRGQVFTMIKASSSYMPLPELDSCRLR